MEWDDVQIVSILHVCCDDDVTDDGPYHAQADTNFFYFLVCGCELRVVVSWSQSCFGGGMTESFKWKLSFRRILLFQKFIPFQQG